MAVMNKMRENTKIVLIILVVAFIALIVFEWGMDLSGARTQQGAIAEVNGQEISAEIFYNNFQGELDRYRQGTGNEPNDAQVNAIRNQVWENLVRDELVTQEINKRGITATIEELKYYIFEDPPALIRQNPSFQDDDGEFDFSKYQAALNNTDPSADQFWRQVQTYLEASVPYQKFQNLIDASVLVTESQIKEEYLKQNQKATVKYVEFPISKYRNEEVTISEEEIEAYYEKNKDEFKEEEKRKIDYVIYSTNPTPKDSQAVRDLAESLLERALNGEDFGELAKTYSEDETNRDKGGDLSYFTRKDMVTPFSEAAFSAEIGSIVGPVKTNFGLHLINVLDKKTEDGEEKVHARHILLKFNASAETISAARDSADYLSTYAKETSWQEAVESEGVKSQTSASFVEGSGFVPGIGVNTTASRFIFRNKLGSISEPFETPQGFLVLRVAEIEEEHIQALEDVKTRIETTLKNERYKQKAQQAAEKFYAELMQSGMVLDSLAARDSVQVKTPEPFSRSSYVTGIGRDQDFIGTAFSLKPGQFSKPVKGLRGSYVIEMISVNEFDENDYNAKKEAIRTQLLTRAKNEAFTKWYAALKDEASIEDYRDLYF